MCAGTIAPWMLSAKTVSTIGAQTRLRRSTTVYLSGVSTRATLIVTDAARDVVPLIHDGFERELHIVRGHRHAVVPARIMHEVIGDGAPIVRDVAVRLSRDARREIGN